MKAALSELLDLFFPPRCVACDVVLGEERFLCVNCQPLVLETPQVRCERCSEPGDFDERLCARCSTSAPPFTHAWAPFEHVGSIAKAIHRFKYEGHSELARPLGSMVMSAGGRDLRAFPGGVCPIPLHDARFRERGYDQATLFAAELARLLARPLHDTWLTRRRATSQQVGLSETDRDNNVRGAFEAAAAVKNQPVILVDDVLTTGATAREATSALLAAGASSVFVVTIARARREHPSGS